jgi:dihydrofolate synthase/folylpolyglutamate synthase
VNAPGPGLAPRAYLSSLELHGIKLGLSTIRALCAALGHPERSYRTVLVAGTNGKGSVAAMASTALCAAGHRTARYTSPHLVRLEERFDIDGAPVGADALDRAIVRVREAVERLQADGVIDVHPTFFEVTTAAAFELFRRAGVEIAVLEVGLGGRFDATSVADPVASAIVSIALDHEAFLGDTLEKIAFEKAGVIRPGVPVVTGELPEDAARVVRAVCAERGAPRVEAPAGCTVDATRHEGLTRLAVATPSGSYGPVTLALRGSHQVGNALVAVRLLEAIDAGGIPVPRPAIESGLSSARWPARLGVYERPGGRRLLVDGAHNPAGAATLATYVSEEWPGGLPVVFGAMRDKHVGGMLAALAPVARALVLTTAPGRRAAEAAELAAAVPAGYAGTVVKEPDVAAALARAWQAGPTIVVAGSLYLAGAVLEAQGLP